jgi:hypothetical protein
MLVLIGLKILTGTGAITEPASNVPIAILPTKKKPTSSINSSKLSFILRKATNPMSPVKKNTALLLHSRKSNAIVGSFEP